MNKMKNDDIIEKSIYVLIIIILLIVILNVLFTIGTVVSLIDGFQLIINMLTIIVLLMIYIKLFEFSGKKKR